jgi:archaellum component FlaC
VKLAHELNHSLKDSQHRMETIMAKVDELKAQITDIGNDITEIDTDLQSVIDKLAAASAGGDGLTAEQVTEISGMLTEIKGRTRTTADKVPNA